MKDFISLKSKLHLVDISQSTNFKNYDLQEIILNNYYIRYNEHSNSLSYKREENELSLYLIGNPVILKDFMELWTAFNIKEYISNKSLFINIFEKLNGIVSILIIDQLNNKISLVTDPLGYFPVFVYEDEKHTILSNSLKSLLDVNELKLELDDNSILNYYNNGHFLSCRTWFKNCRKIGPATFLTYSINENIVYEQSYWTWSTLIKSTQSKENLLTLYQEKFENQFEIFENNNQHIGVALSGGLDSRWLVHLLTKKNTNTAAFTFSTRDAIDSRIARNICVKLNIPWRHFSIKFENWFEERLPMFWEADGLVPIMHFHEGNIYSTIAENYDLIATGFYGGGIYSNHDNINKRITSYLAHCVFHFTETEDNTSSRYFDFNSIDPYYSTQIISNLGAIHVYNMTKHFKVFIPFYNLDWLKVNYSIDESFQVNSKFYLEALNKNLSKELLQLPWQKTLTPLKYYRLNSFILKNKLYKVIYKVLGLFGIHSTFVNYSILHSRVNSILKKLSVPTILRNLKPNSIEQKMRMASIAIWLQMLKKKRSNVL